MRRLRERSIVRDLVIGLAATITATCSILGVGVYLDSAQYGTTEIRREANQIVSYLADALAYPAWNLETDEIQQILDHYEKNPIVAAIDLVDEYGEPIARHGEPSPSPFLALEREVRYEGQVIGKVKAHFTNDSVARSLKRRGIEILFIWLVLMGATLTVTVKMLGAMLEGPLAQLQRVIEAMTRGDYTQTLGPVKQVEMNTLRDRVNTMARELTQRERAAVERRAGSDGAGDHSAPREPAKPNSDKQNGFDTSA